MSNSRHLDYTRLYAALAAARGSITAEDVATKAHMTIDRARSALASLELKGAVLRLPKASRRDETRWVPQKVEQEAT